MLIRISDVYYLMIQLPGNTWQAVKDFFGITLRKWWFSHYLG